MSSRLASLGRALRAPFVSVAVGYNNTARKNPFLTGVITTVVKTSAADTFAQKVLERKDEMDWNRHGMFVFFGFAYLGCWQFHLYNTLFVKWCRPITAAVGHIGSSTVKTFIDQCIHHPFLYFPAFYVLKGAVEGRPIESTFFKYRRDLWENCKALWTIWVPAQLVNFAFVPQHLRIPYVALVSFVWTVIISVMRGGLERPATVSVGEPNHVASMESVEIGHIAGRRLPVPEVEEVVAAGDELLGDQSGGVAVAAAAGEGLLGSGEVDALLGTALAEEVKPASS